MLRIDVHFLSRVTSEKSTACAHSSFLLSPPPHLWLSSGANRGPRRAGSAQRRLDKSHICIQIVTYLTVTAGPGKISAMMPGKLKRQRIIWKRQRDTHCVQCKRNETKGNAMHCLSFRFVWGQLFEYRPSRLSSFSVTSAISGNGGKGRKYNRVNRKQHIL